MEESQKVGSPHPGLPAPLPRGEHVVWQGTPRWQSFARQVFRTDLILIYFAVLAVWRVATIIEQGRGMEGAVQAVLVVASCGALVIGLFALLAWLGARATIYTITNRRIVMRIGAAFSKTIDIPFKVIDSVQVKTGASGTGNISIKLKDTAGIPYLILWPHARPWRLRYPEPTLRAVPNAQETAETLASQLEAAARSDLDSQAPDQEHALEGSSLPPSSAETPADPDQVDVPMPVPPANPARLPLLGAASLVVVSIVAVAWVQLNRSGSEEAGARTPQTVYQMDFRDIGSDRIAVVDTGLEETITIVEAGKDGLVRRALKGLERTRTLQGLPVDAPYQVIIWDTGRLTLSDLGTDRHIPLDSFGPTGTGALKELLRLKPGGV